MRRFFALWLALICLLLALGGCGFDAQTDRDAAQITREAIPDYSGAAYVEVEGGVPRLQAEDFSGESFETYSSLDSLGRCGTAYACVGLDLMPTEKRGSIGSVKPSGWQTAKYDCVEGRYLYNRCHLIGYQLSGENANARNLITGTRYLNTQGMLPFENMVADYVKETENHVLYRVTPVFYEQELVARGVLMEGWSVEDEGEGICFFVYAYNVQPGIEIDYATGESRLKSQTGETEHYILNTNTRKFHKPECASAASIQPDNRQEYEGSREQLIQQGYQPCGSCRP